MRPIVASRYYYPDSTTQPLSGYAPYLTTINVTYWDEIPERETKNLLQFREKFKPMVRERILLTKEIEPEKDGIKFVPVWKWLLGF